MKSVGGLSTHLIQINDHWPPNTDLRDCAFSPPERSGSDCRRCSSRHLPLQFRFKSSAAFSCSRSENSTGDLAHSSLANSRQSSDSSFAWTYWRKLGEPKLIVAPMYEASELPFRMLCRKYGAEAAYTPMLHSRIFAESEKHRSKEFSTCKEDRPLFVQFCGNDPDILLEAAQRVEPYCDYVDINLGCPQHIAKRGYYGAFLMDNLPLVKSLVERLAINLKVPLSCKIRVFPDLQDTINYARMLEDSGCSLLAVHGRTRDERSSERANWSAIRAVKDAVTIPVLANGNVRHMDDVLKCLEETSTDGVLSAESLLDNPALFAGYRTAEWALGCEDIYVDGNLDHGHLVVEYLKLCEKYPVSWKIVISHVYRLLGKWFEIHPDIRGDLNAQKNLTFEFLYDLVGRLRDRGVQLPLYVKDTLVWEEK